MPRPPLWQAFTAKQGRGLRGRIAPAARLDEARESSGSVVGLCRKPDGPVSETNSPFSDRQGKTVRRRRWLPKCLGQMVEGEESHA